MNDKKTIPEFTSYAEMEEFWDTHNLGDYWEQTEPAEFEISPQARRHENMFTTVGVEIKKE